MGLGFSINVATPNKYPTIIDNMVSEGVIAHPSFSLYLVRLPQLLARRGLRLC